MMGVRKLLAVFAHPDDESFICGGTLARCAQEAVEVTLVSATKGEMGRRMGQPPRYTRESIASVREAEMTEACRILGIHRLEWLGMLDKTVEFADEEQTVGQLVRMMAEIQPDVVLTFHERYGGHPDHCAIGRYCSAAFERARLMKGGPKRLCYINFGDPSPLGFSSDEIIAVDIRKQQREKLLSFRAHRSQTEMQRNIWQDVERAASSVGRTEYFILGGGERLKGATDLFAVLDGGH